MRPSWSAQRALDTSGENPRVSALWWWIVSGHHHCRAGAGAFAPAESNAHYPPDLQLEPVHLDLAVRLDLSARRADVQLGVKVRARATRVRTLRLDGIDFRELSGELPAGGHVEYDGRHVCLIWDQPFAAGEEREAVLRYHVVRPITGLHFSVPDAATPEAQTFAVTDHETERARYWLACVDHPSVRPSLCVHIRAAEALTILANGALSREERHGDGTKTAHFEQDEGCPSYLLCFAVGEFERWSGGEHRGIEIAAFVPRPFTAEHAERSFRRTRDMLEYLSERLGAYPFAKYYQFAAEGIGGAMENISLVSWDDRFLLDPVLETEERQLVDCINLHEMAHSWFGDRVVCRDFAHSWLKEGWATYMESCWLEDREGPDALGYDLACNAEAYFAEADEKYQRAIVTRRYESSFDLFDRHLYPGAALRIHMLRRKLGDEVFWPAVRAYLAANAGKLVETDDFRRALESHSGVSLGHFFEQWFERPGYPDLQVTFRHDVDAGEGTFEVIQKQADAKSGEGAFRFELDVAYGDEGALARRTLAIAGRRTVAVVAMAQAPALIRIDPEARVLHRLDFDPGRPRLERQLRASDASGRIQAAKLLTLHAGAAGVRAVHAAFAAEPYWGVRVKWAEALGKAGSTAALDALLELCASHADVRVLAALFKALGRYRDPRVIDVASARLDAGLPYRAAEAALEALGAQRERAPLERLAAAAARPGFGGFVQSGALRALGATRRPEALEPLVLALAPGGAPNRVRPAAAAGLGALAATLAERPRERALEALTGALRDADTRVQLAAAEALGEAKAFGAEPALEALARRLPAQYAATVRRVIRGLRKAASSSARPQQLEELEERLRKLSAKVEELEARLERAQ